MVDTQVTGAGSDGAQAYLLALVRHRMAQLPEIALMDGPPVGRGARGCAGGAPKMQLRLVLGREALQVRVESAEGFGADFAAAIPVVLPVAGAPGRDVVQAVDAAFMQGLQATLAMQAADRADGAVLRQLVAGDRAPAPRPLTPAALQALQTYAIRRTAQRRDLTAAPILRGLVVQAAETGAPLTAQALGLQAVGSLMALCDREAVLPMVALAQHREPAFVVQLAHAIGQVGGPMAEAYLVTLASGHLDDQVRQGAAQALQDLQLRRRTGVGCGSG